MSVLQIQILSVYVCLRRLPIERHFYFFVTVSQQGRIFINFPKWGDDVQCSVAEIRNGRPEAYPNEAFNRTEDLDLVGSLVSVQSVVVDPIDQIKTDGLPFDTQKIHTTI